MSTSSGRPANGARAGAGRPNPATATAAQPTARRSVPPAARPQQRTSPTAAPGNGEPRKVKLTLSRIDPFSVMKISFLLSVAVGIAGVVVIAALWLMLNSMGVFSILNDSVNEVMSASSGENKFSVLELMSFGRVVSLAVVFGVIDVILMTAIATIMAFIYNLCAALVGGVQVTLADD